MVNYLDITFYFTLDFKVLKFKIISFLHFLIQNYSKNNFLLEI